LKKRSPSSVNNYITSGQIHKL